MSGVGQPNATASASIAQLPRAMSTARPNCFNCKGIKRVCEDIENGKCAKCRKDGIDCEPYTPKRKGRPPGTKDSQPQKQGVRRKLRGIQVDEQTEDENDGDSLNDADSDGRPEATGDEVGPPHMDERRQETDEEEMGEDTRFSTIMGYHAKTIAVPGGLWEFDRIAVGTGGKGRGGGRFIPIPSDSAAVSAAINTALQNIDERHADSGPPRKKLRLELNGVLRGSAKRAAAAAARARSAPTPEPNHVDNGLHLPSTDEDDSVVDIPPLQGFSESTKLSRSGLGGPGNLFDKIEAAISDSRQYTKLKGLTEDYQKNESITPEEYLQSAVRIIGAREELIEELRMWLGLRTKSTSGTNQQFPQSGEHQDVQVRDFARTRSGGRDGQSRVSSGSVTSGDQIVAVQNEHEAQYQRLVAMNPPPRARSIDTATNL